MTLETSHLMGQIEQIVAHPHSTITKHDHQRALAILLLFRKHLSCLVPNPVPPVNLSEKERKELENDPLFRTLLNE